ncbi:MAG: hypothetical protein IPH62_16415 [Ignavibacteriae bacterium]|nr:hypothetical protein [Ignavibacteriota bacterium]
MKTDWMKNIDIEPFLDSQLKRVLEIVGKEKFLILFSEFGKSSVYFSTKSLLECKKKYIKMNRDITVKQLANDLEVSERFVYSFLKGQNNGLLYEEF